MQPVEAGDGYSTSPAREYWFFLPGSERKDTILGDSTMRTSFLGQVTAHAA